ncbi:hypothetical protein [Pseudomonas sp. MONT-RG-20F-20-E-7-02]|uniref:hypothetical protein n=1 Tax=Pseudomonas sp. MONT-RG-20F-20-E-7-02 TaxID=2914979 RepID=UPI001F59239F|nr:hypothetical protein [Pseudomonas sp. MONT-RG-20F-20-E-7-02]
MSMKKIDKLLSAIGLVRKSEHESIVESHKDFTRLLGNAAKDAGVLVLLDNQSLRGVEIDSDIFVLGSRNYIHDCFIAGGSFRCSPSAQFNMFQNNTFIPTSKGWYVE